MKPTNIKNGAQAPDDMKVRTVKDKIVQDDYGLDHHVVQIEVDRDWERFTVYFAVRTAVTAAGTDWRWNASVARFDKARTGGAVIYKCETRTATESEAVACVKKARAFDELDTCPEQALSNCDLCGGGQTLKGIECVEVTRSTMWCLACVERHPKVKARLKALGWQCAPEGWAFATA